jgi:glycosyltransferase involved in cell wall biosynthesis
MASPPLKSWYWRARYRKWGRTPKRQDGYTVLVPVPGDLPVFLDVALRTLATQDADNRRQILVIPDQETPEFAAAYDAHRRSWTGGELSLVRLPAPERVVLPKLNDPARNYASQLVAGIRASEASHVVFHDADLVIHEPRLHEQLYATMREGDLDVCGVDSSWDAWYAAHDLTLVATWEMCANVDWLHRFPPYRHFGHDDTFLGEPRVFDVTFWPQCHSDPTRRRVVPGLRYTHFNYVISTYRFFQAATGEFPDRRFRLLLIRLLTDMFSDNAPQLLPSADVLAEGLEPGTGPVRYLRATAEDYVRFRRQATNLLTDPLLTEQQRSIAQTVLRPFDEWAGYDEASYVSPTFGSNFRPRDTSR